MHVLAHTKWTSVVVALALVLAGCDDGLLDLQPESELTSATFWTTENDAMLALTGVYAARAFINETAILEVETVTDNLIRTGGTFMLRPELTPTDGAVAGLWEDAYEQIARANNFLENIEGVEMNEEKKREMIAEVRFLRAWAYYNLSQYWGSVPLITEVLTMEEANSVSRVPKEEVVGFVLSELDAVAQDLPTTRPSGEHGRIIQSAALAVEGRLLMAEERWSDAASTYRQIIDMGIHAIDDDYKGLFDGSNEESSEIIFTSKYLQNVESNELQRDVRPNLYGGWHFYNPYQNLIDAYPAEDGLPISESPLYDPDRPYENRDSRLYHNFFLPAYTRFAGKLYHGHPDSTDSGDAMGGEDPEMTGYAVKKYVDEDYVGNIYVGGTDIPVIRYAEVLLSYLEAVIRSGGGVDQALLDETINSVRGRASVDMPPITETNPDELLDLVKLERRIELPVEGLRYWDLSRWGEWEGVSDRTFYGIKLTDDPANYAEFQVNDEGHYVVYAMSFDPARAYQWPIPQDEIDVNPNLEQYPQY